MGPKIDELLQPEARGHRRVLQNAQRIQILEDGRVPVKDARNWKIERKEGSQGKNTEDCGMGSKREDSWH